MSLVTNELIEKLTEAETSKTILDALIKKRTYDQAASALSKTAEATDTEGPATATSTSQNKKTKLSAKDNVHIGSSTTTLGESLLEYNENLLINSPEDKYFSYLSQNFIIDISSKSQVSQLSYFGAEMSNTITEKYAFKTAPNDDQNIPKIINSLKKKIDAQSLKKVRTIIDSYQANDTHTRYIKKIYDHIISLHIDRPHMFNKQSRKGYTERDYEIKFWGVVFESYFHSDEYMLHWGDTISAPCKKSQLRFKADLRIVIMSPDEDVVDGATAEIAKKATPKKLFMDKLKSVLGTKCHLNNFLQAIPFIPAKEAKNVVFPIVQIMGFDVRVYTLRLANRGLYILQDQISFSFPTNYSSLKLGISNIINGLSSIQSLLIELKRVYETYQMDNSDAMKRILSGNGSRKKTNINGWITEVVWNEEEEKDDEEDEEKVLEEEALDADEDEEDEDEGC